MMAKEIDLDIFGAAKAYERLAKQDPQLPVLAQLLRRSGDPAEHRQELHRYARRACELVRPVRKDRPYFTGNSGFRSGGSC
jgi:hypothetical protein